jgi:hypothetical protein
VSVSSASIRTCASNRERSRGCDLVLHPTFVSSALMDRVLQRFHSDSVLSFQLSSLPHFRLQSPASAPITLVSILARRWALLVSCFSSFFFSTLKIQTRSEEDDDGRRRPDRNVGSPRQLGDGGTHWTRGGSGDPSPAVRSASRGCQALDPGNPGVE